MKSKLLFIIAIIALLLFPKINFGQAPTLGTASGFVLFTSSGAFHAVGASYVTGDIGTYVGAYTGFPPGTLVGTAHIADSASFYAAADVSTAYSNLFARTCDTTIGTTLGYSQVLTPRVYCMGAASSFVDTLFLDAQGNANAIFIIKINGALLTATHTHVILRNSASLCNVYWQINGAFTLGDSSTFIGTLLVNGAITLNTGASLNGRGLSKGGDVNIAAVVATIPSSCSATAPNITTQPTNQTTCIGSSATFSVTATGTSLTYQWRKGTTNISGANSSSYTISSTAVSDTSTNYNVVVSGSTSPTATSSNASLTVNTVPSISSAPTNQTACVGSSAIFSVTSTGTVLTYQWRKGTTNISGATSASFTISSVAISDSASNYNVVVSGTCSPASTSSNVSLTVSSLPVITTAPTNQTACVGSSASFSVAAAGTALTYQWRKGTTNISGATSSSLTIGSLAISDTASNYNVVVSGTCSPNATSSNVSLSLNTTPGITTSPTNQTACVGSSATFSVTATGTALTYQWRKGITNIPGATAASYTISSAAISDTATNYNVVVSGTCSPTSTSLNVSLTVNSLPVITSAPTNQTACVGNSVSFSVAATGTSITYQWRKGTTNISGATSALLTINPVAISDAATNFNVVVSGTCSPASTSSNVSLTVNTAPAISSLSSNQTICVGNSANFSVTATGTALTYQWRKGTTNISGATSASFTINSVAVSDTASNYNVVISGTCSPTNTSSNISLSLYVTPIITTAPANQTVCVGNSANFSVVASGTALTYQWRKGTTNISGATSSLFTISSAAITDTASNYNVVVSGTCSPSSTSSNVYLIVNTAPSITSAPANQTVCAGSSASFSVVATGTALTYQWRIGTVNISGATSSSFTINTVSISDAATNYNVVVSGTCSPASTSSNVSLTVNAAPAISSAPTNQSVCVGNFATFSVTVTGTALTYQWRTGTTNISGATSSSFTINPVSLSDAATNYNVVVSGTCSPASTSSNASLTVNTAPVITTSPVSLMSTDSGTANFSVVATGTALTYQWRKGTVNLTNGGKISGATSATLTIFPVNISDTSSNYNVVVSGTCSPAVTSINASLFICICPSITTQPINQTACVGGSTSFSVIATGISLSYQWRKGTLNISGANSPTLTINSVASSDTASNYNVVVSGYCSSVSTSSNVSLILNGVPIITTTPVSQTTCVRGLASFSVAATGTALTYQWRKGTTNISGATSSSLTIYPVSISDTASNYNVVVNGACSPALTSSNISLTVNSVPSISTSPINQTACVGSSTSFSVVATGTSLTYQWRKGTTNISGATSSSLTIYPVSISDTASNYNVVVNGACSPALTSSNISLTVNSVPSISTSPINQTACVGSSTSFSVVATGTSLTYQWRKGTTNISGATSSSLTIYPVSISDTASNYNVVVNGACAPASTSSNVSLTVNSVPSISSTPTNQTVCVGSSASFGVTATGTALTYQWRKGTTNISGATSSTLSIYPVSISDTASNYNVVVSGTCAPASTSSNVSLTVNSVPSISSTPTNQTVCVGSSASFGVTATGTALTYQWRKGTTNISGATSNSYIINPVSISDSASNYNVVISGTCSPASTTSNVSLVVNSAPTISSAPTNQTVCAGNLISFSTIATGTSLTYQWRKGTTNISGATSSSLTIYPVSISDTATNYNVVVNGTCSPANTSSNVSLTVNSIPSISSAPTNQTVCVGSSATFSVSATGTALTYQWRKGATNISGATSSTLTINPATLTDVATNYNVVINGTCSPALTSSNVYLTVNSAPSISSSPINQTTCAGNLISFSTTATGTSLTYQWRKGTTNISGATSSTLSIYPVSISDTASNYNVVVNGTCSPANISSNVSLVVNSAPFINKGPVDQTVCAGNPVSYFVDATGTTLTYQWRKGTINITGETASSLTINSVSVTDASSNYNVVVNGTCSSALTSQNVSLTVNTSPTITAGPNNQSGCNGGSESFWVDATGTGLTYQWRKGTLNLIDGGKISGSTSPILIINPADITDTGSNYNVVVSGTCSPNVTSTFASLLICTETGITSIGAGNTDATVSVYPNPFTNSLNIIINDASQIKEAEVRIYNVLGAELMNTIITKQVTVIETNNLTAGIYFFRVTSNDKTIQSGKLISQ